MSLLVKSGRKWVKVSRSDSDFDNVESITMNDIAPGTYRLVVRADRPEPYSLAWMTAEEDVWTVPEYLCTIRHMPLFKAGRSRMGMPRLSRVDDRSFAAGLVGRVS